MWRWRAQVSLELLFLAEQLHMYFYFLWQWQDVALCESSIVCFFCTLVVVAHYSARYGHFWRKRRLWLYSCDWNPRLSQPFVLREWIWLHCERQTPPPSFSSSFFLSPAIHIRMQRSKNEPIHTGARWYSRRRSLGLSQTHSSLGGLQPIAVNLAGNVVLCCSWQIAYWYGQFPNGPFSTAHIVRNDKDCQRFLIFQSRNYF